MKDDRRKAWFGGSYRVASIADATDLYAHPAHAKLYKLSVAAAGTARLHLPAAGSRHLRPGFVLAVLNFDAGGGGDVELIDAADNPILMLDGASSVGPSEVAFVYLYGFASEDVPIWLVHHRARGAYATP